MINAADMTVGMKVVVEGLGTLTLAEPVGECPHTAEAPVEVEVLPGQFELVQPTRQIRTLKIDGEDKIATVDGKALDVCERWLATDENGVLRVVDCRLCEVA